MKEKKETMKEKNKKQKVVLQLCFDQEEIIIIIKKTKSRAKTWRPIRGEVYAAKRGELLWSKCAEKKNQDK